MRIGGSPCLRRRNADGDHTHALVAEQSQSFPDNLVALLGHSRAWNCSTQKRAIRAVGVGLLILECAAENVRYLGQSGEHILPASFTARDPLRTFRLGIARIRVARVGSSFDAEAQSKINASRTLLRMNRIGHIGCYRILTSDEPEIQPNSAVLQITSAANAEPVAFRHREQ